MEAVSCDSERGRGVLVSPPSPSLGEHGECLSLPCHVPGGRKFFLAEQLPALPEGSGTYCSAGGAASDALGVISALTAKIHHTGPRCQRAPQEPGQGGLQPQRAPMDYPDPITAPWEIRECPAVQRDRHCSAGLSMEAAFNDALLYDPVGFVTSSQGKSHTAMSTPGF